MTSEKFLDDLHEAARTSEVSDYIAEREARLAASAPPIVYHGEEHRFTTGYIHPDSSVNATRHKRGFRLDDPEPNRRFAHEVLRLESEGFEPSTDSLVLKAAQLAVAGYFGFDADTNENLRLMGKVLRNKPRSIRELASQGAAIGYERAAASHNMCLIGGVDSAYLMGLMDFRGVSRPHAFQLVRENRTNKLFDPTVPHLEIRDEVIVVRPSTVVVDALKFISEHEVLRSVITVRKNGNKFEHDVAYSFWAAYPATFEAYYALSHTERTDLKKMEAHTYVDLAEGYAATAILRTKFGNVVPFPGVAAQS